MCQALNQALKTRVVKTEASHRTDPLAVEGDDGQALNPREAMRVKKEEEWDPHRDSDQKKLPQRTPQAEI